MSFSSWLTIKSRVNARLPWSALLHASTRGTRTELAASMTSVSYSCLRAHGLTLSIHVRNYGNAVGNGWHRGQEFHQ